MNKGNSMYTEEFIDEARAWVQRNVPYSRYEYIRLIEEGHRVTLELIAKAMELETLRVEHAKLMEETARLFPYPSMEASVFLDKVPISQEDEDPISQEYVVTAQFSMTPLVVKVMHFDDPMLPPGQLPDMIGKSLEFHFDSKVDMLREEMMKQYGRLVEARQ